MSIVIFDAGKLQLLDRLVGNNTYPCFQNARAELFVNNHVPVDTDTAGAFTLASWSGYASQTIGSWSASALSGGVGLSTGAAVNFGNSTGSTQLAYGILLFDPSSGLLLAGAYFAGAPVNVSTLGLIVQVTLEDATL